MSEHYRTLSAIFPIILNSDAGTRKILLHKRKNTGYEDGKWDIAGSGHVDAGETARLALIRECKEELGIVVRQEDLSFAHLSHRFAADRVYYDIYFIVKKYSGAPAIMEPQKCAGLEWFAIDKLPQDIIKCRRADIQNYFGGVLYSEKIE